MDSIVSWIAIGAATLFVVAVAVAWWEHLVRNAAQSAGSIEAAATARPRIVTVDVALDALTAPATEGDTAARREALDGALGRMAMAGASAEARRAWIDTAPMVGPGQRDEPAPRSQSQPAER
jgi:hypothetical protein